MLKGWLNALVLGIFALAVGLGVRLVMFHYAQEQVSQALVSLQQQQLRQAEEMNARVRYQAQVYAAQARHMVAPPQGRVLASNEICLGGSIVRVEKINGVATYTQLSDGAHPTACPE